MRDFAKFSCSFWTSSSIQALSDAGKVLAAYLISGPHSNMAGVYRLPGGYVMADLEWTSGKVADAFLELRQRGFATWCRHTNWVVVHKALKHTPPENPAQRTHVESLVRKLPLEATVRADAAQALTDYFPGVPEPLLEWLRGSQEVVARPSQDQQETVSRPSRDPLETTATTSREGLRSVSAGEVEREVEREVEGEREGEGEARASRALPAGQKPPGQPPSRRKPKATATPLPADFTISEAVRTWATKKGWAPFLEAHLEFFIDYAKARPAEVRYDDWDCAFRNCIRCDWGRIREALLKNGVKVVLPPPVVTCQARMGDLPCSMPGKPRAFGEFRCDRHEEEHEAACRAPMAPETRAKLDQLLRKVRPPS